MLIIFVKKMFMHVHDIHRLYRHTHYIWKSHKIDKELFKIISFEWWNYRNINFFC